MKISRGGLSALLISATLVLPAAARADEVRVMISGGFSAAYKQLVPQFEQATRHKVLTAYGPSMGTTENAIPVRLARGEPVDVLIMVGKALTGLTEQGKADKASRVDLARSPIGIAVRAGAPKPDISSVDGLRSALLDAKSIAYSDSASGVYVGNELFKRLGIEEQMKGKARMIPAEPVAAVVARGEAELGFQQISELLPVAGVEVVGPIPEAVQKITIFAAGLSSNAISNQAGAALIAFLASAEAAPVIRKTGLEPLAPPAGK
ncbi:substrate-binding domain-containing protein [Xanthobacter sp.]|uniref:substrate-binding domain-containing protein n=1 Tax=Xanthobacter sp. TaxID=35809 RepID=UPI0025FD8BA4|nr:substrate-binding domain-containing protein [Xanthobacter sp.]